MGIEVTLYVGSSSGIPRPYIGTMEFVSNNPGTYACPAASFGEGTVAIVVLLTRCDCRLPGRQYFNSLLVWNQPHDTQVRRGLRFPARRKSYRLGTAGPTLVASWPI